MSVLPSLRAPLARVAALLLALPALSSLALAGDLTVQSTGPAVTVVRDEQVIGTTPLTLTALPEGAIDLGFRETALGATVFTQRVSIPATGLVTLEVDLPQRLARTVAPPAPAPVKATPAGDVYVTSTPAGATVWIDGAATPSVTPAMIRDLPVGKHTVQVRTECARAQADISIANGVIARTELVPVTGKGAVSLTGTPASARVLVDGAEAGVLPTTVKDLSCGDHQIAVRAPGYLEDTRTVRVPAYETTAIAITLQKEEFGTLVVDLTPLEATLLVDSINLGTGPRTVERIAVGPHRVEGRLDGYAPLVQDVTISANAVSRVDLTLSAPVATTPAAVPEPVKAEPAPWARIALNSVVTVGSLGAGAFGLLKYGQARDAYDVYAAIDDEAEAEAVYAETVAPPRNTALALGIGALVGVGASTALWVTTEF